MGGRKFRGEAKVELIEDLWITPGRKEEGKSMKKQTICSQSQNKDMNWRSKLFAVSHKTKAMHLPVRFLSTPEDFFKRWKTTVWQEFSNSSTWFRKSKISKIKGGFHLPQSSPHFRWTRPLVTNLASHCLMIVYNCLWKIIRGDKKETPPDNFRFINERSVMNYKN